MFFYYSNILIYQKGPKYKKALNKKYDFSKASKFLVDYKKDASNFLFCKLTKTKLYKSKNVIVKHINGKRFLKKVDCKYLTLSYL